MSRLPILLITLLTLIANPAAAANDTPNIVIILADDFGVGDIQAHYPDNKIATPHLDRLVQQGMSFTDAHSPSAVCSPTRYGLITGRYSWRTRMQEWVVAVYEPPLITSGRPTLPAMLKQQGYHTACIGKWHLGWDWAGPQKGRMTEKPNGQKDLTWDFTKPVLGGPIHRGFDYFFGVDLPNLPPFAFIENDRLLVQPTAQYKLDNSEGVNLPRGFVGAPMAPGWKLQGVLPELTRRAVKHIHEQAKKDQPFFLYFTQTSPHEPVSPSKDFVGKSGINPVADFVMETDWSAGQVIQAIDDAGIADNTLVIFTADNGHSHYTGWPDLIKAGHMPSGPYRGHKGDVWEGGHRVPLILRWPKHITAGSSSQQMISLTDLFATCAEITGAELPKDGAEDSISFLSAALGKKNTQPRTSLVNHSNHGEFAWRDGPWKLVFKESAPRYAQSRGKPTIVELYNLDDDVAESNNLSDKHPDVVKRMTAQLSEVIARGASRTGLNSANDTDVRFDTIQMQRWAPAAK
ncbi:MAG: arylsulfatase [Verrucomicrobiota bacterium]